MAAVPLPPLAKFPAAKETALPLHLALREQFAVEVPVIFWSERLWVRISAQMYNTTQDYEALRDAIATLRSG